MSQDAARPSTARQQDASQVAARPAPGHGQWTGAALLLVAAFCFSAKAIMVKLAYRHGVDATTMLFLRMVFALPFFAAVLWAHYRRGATRPTRRDLVRVALLGVVGYYLSSFLDFAGLQYLSASLERLILFVYPTIVVLIMAVVYRKPIGGRAALALLLTYAGVAVVFWRDDLSGQRNVPLGAALIFASAISYAIYLVGSGQLIPRFGAVGFTAHAMVVSCLAVVAQYVLTRPLAAATRLPAPVYGWALAIALFSTVIPTFLVSKGIQVIGASRAAIVASVGPIATIALSYFVLDEPVTWLMLVGTGLVLTGVGLVSAGKAVPAATDSLATKQIP